LLQAREEGRLRVEGVQFEAEPEYGCLVQMRHNNLPALIFLERVLVLAGNHSKKFLGDRDPLERDLDDLLLIKA
jgi:hypothetical protein